MGTVNTDKYFTAFKIKNISEISAKELKRRFRILANRYHPDHGGTNGQFRFIQESYLYLKARMDEFLKIENKKFYNKNFFYYGDGSIYDIKNKKWVKFKGQKV